MPVQERRQTDLRVLNFAILGVVFKRQHGSEGVNSQSLSESEREREREMTVFCLFAYRKKQTAPSILRPGPKRVMTIGLIKIQKLNNFLSQPNWDFGS